MEAASRAIDLFAGAGGATQGLLDASVTVLAAIENDPYAASSYRLNHEQVRLYERDIRRVTARRLLKDLELEPGDLEILQACPPCPSWSTLGATPSSDPRRNLLKEVFRFIRVLRPKVFILENVPGLAADPQLKKLLEGSADSVTGISRTWSTPRRSGSRSGADV